MRLQAISAGTGVQSDRFTGVVHSVFRRACNIQTERGELLVLLASELGNVPHGIRVRVPAGLAFADHLRAGQRVGCRARVLRIAGSGFAVDMSTAEVWRGRLAAVDLGRPAAADAWRIAWRALERHGAGRDHDPLLRTVRERGLALAEASRVLDIDRAVTAMGALIGCGPGLTPAGDDLIVGCLTGLLASRDGDSAKRCFLDALATAIATAVRGTGAISRAYLEHASRGHVAEPLARLAGAIADGALPAEVEAAAGRALGVGHSSGGDGVFGLLLGMQAWSSACEPGDG
jgi:Protein of unknown function (DUF2877)